MSNGINPVFLLGMQRSGTNFTLSIIKTLDRIVTFNEDYRPAFENFVLKDKAAIEAVMAENAGHICCFKAISNTVGFRQLRADYPNAAMIFTYRRPSSTIDSFAFEFSWSQSVVNQVLDSNFFRGDLIRLAGWRPILRVMSAINRYKGRFSAATDYGNKIALFWLLQHLFLIESQALTSNGSLLVSYEEITSDPQAFRTLIADRFLASQSSGSTLPFLNKTGRYFHEQVAPDLMAECDALYEELEELRLSSRQPS